MSGNRFFAKGTRAWQGFALAVLLCLFVGRFGFAQATGEVPQARPVGDPAIEARALKLGHELRCLVCQNQSIAESNAELAHDLMNQVREQLAAGKSEEEVRAYLVARYGDFVLYQPPLKASTVALWVGPFVLVLAGVLALWRALRRRAREGTPTLSADEAARAEALLRGTNEGERS
ncbi:cytochrome c-type biogenesis protein [Tepidiphilus margaritifer]|uniref:cytochrome c-type biogenesis protein n=1 Tax=Tepidiphilus margaritifer TaxID=203471 RepID=UPI0003F51ED9|nr:cytochrome c-type biogenesis protein [Tepidiphilus margaritifer]